MNEAQIRKLQAKVAKESEKKFAERDKRERELLEANMKEMTSEMKRLEALHPQRGPCHCVWEGWVYLLRKGSPFRASKVDLDDIQELKRVHAASGKSYHMYSEEAFKENSEFMHWISDHYAEFRFSFVQANKAESAHERITNMFALGGLYEEMSKKFPKKTPMDLKEGLQAMDMLLQQGVE